MKTLIVEGSRPIGAPKDWDQKLDGHCGVLHVLDQTEMLSGMNVMFSFYKPTPEDIEAFQAGGIIRLGISGRSHPVIQLGVLGKSIVDVAKPKEGFDMGPVIELGDE